DLQRNLRRYIASEACPLDSFVPGWRAVVDEHQADRTIRQAILQHWLARIRELDMAPSDGIELVTAEKNQQLYWLVFAARHPKAGEFWDKIRNPSSQGRLL